MRVFKDSDFKKIDGHVCKLPQGGLRQVLIEKWIRENYKKTDISFITNLVTLYVYFLRGFLAADEIETIFSDCQIRIAVDDENTESRIFTYGTFYKKEDLQKIGIESENGLTIVWINTYTQNSLRTSNKDLEKFIQKVNHYFVHEDTHKQQYSKYKNYDLPKILPGDNRYYSNGIECDAFGRQVGQALRQENPNANISQIFKKIRDFDIEDEDALTLLEIYTSNQVKEKSRRKFIRAFYDFIEGNED